MKIDTLKDRARKHEQNEEWGQALSVYLEAIAAIEEGEEPDITLYNRAADIQVRLKDVAGAIEHYEQALDLYLEADLPNNAYAVCRKILRTVPDRPATYLRMGQIRARQGFVIDARQNYLAYAEMMETKGDTDEALRALEEFTGLVPEDVETRIFLGEQLMARERREDGLRHMLDAWARLERGGAAEAAAELRKRIEELDPGARFPRVVAGEEEAAPSPEGKEWGGDFGRPAAFEPTAFGGLEPEEASPGAAGLTDFADVEDSEFSPEESGEPLEGDAPDQVAASGEADPWSRGHEPGERERDELDDTTELEPLDVDLAEIALDEHEDEGEEPAALPLLGEPGAESATAAPPSGELEELRARIEEEPDRIELHERRVEMAYRVDDRGLLISAYVGLADAFARTGEEEKADSVFQQVLQLDPRNERALAALGRTPEPEGAGPGEPSPNDASGTKTEAASAAEGEAHLAGPGEPGFVDFGSLVLDDRGPETTRWVVEGHDPSGDEDADFARMLSEFKSKVADNLAADDARAQYDLGTAYKEMGLLDEAISMFQKALRTRENHLASLEMLGQCFLERGEPGVAIRVLRRALEGSWEVEEDLLGIHYYLGHAFEQAGQPEEARECYEKVFALDINFKDVTDRLRALR